MKKLLFVISAGFFCFLISCTEKKEAGTSDAAQKNITAFKAVSDAFTTGDVSKIDSFVAADFVDHAGMHGDGNRDSLKAMIVQMSKDKTAKTETKLLLANDEYVAGWLHMTGTHDGSMGPQGSTYDMNAFELVKCKDGKATEHWTFMSMGDVMKMMTPPPGPAMDTMTTK